MKRIELKGLLKKGDILKVTNYRPTPKRTHSLYKKLTGKVTRVTATQFYIEWNLNKEHKNWNMYWTPSMNGDFDDEYKTDYQIVGGLIHPLLNLPK